MRWLSGPRLYPLAMYGVDPLALYGALLATLVFAIQLRREIRDRPRLSAEVSASWPEFAPNKYSDVGGDPGPMYVRLEVTNVGRRTVTLRAAGLSMRMVESPVRSVKVGRGMDRFRVPFMKRGVHENVRLAEGESWVLERKGDDVAWDVRVQQAGHMVINGAYAETSTGKTHFWSVKQAIREDMVIDLGQPPWEPPSYDTDNPPADDLHADRQEP